MQIANADEASRYLSETDDFCSEKRTTVGKNTSGYLPYYEQCTLANAPCAVSAIDIKMKTYKHAFL